MNQILMVVVWWLAIQAFGLAVLPLTRRVFANLPDQGWAFARPVGLLVVGYLFWQGATFGVLTNAWSAIVGTLLVVGIASWLLCWREVVSLPAFVRSHRGQIVTIEIVFSLAFLFWTVMRAYNPDIAATEKPMELAFLNGVLRSDQFPPLDPWLSGFAISYYYFGYVIAGMLARLTATPAQFAFNLMLPTLFALTATGAYTIGSNLYAGARGGLALARLKRTIASGLLAVAMVLFLSNLEPVLEILNAHRMLSPEAHRFWNIKDMPPAYEVDGLFPSDRDGWWWFRATRVIGRSAPEASGVGSRDLDYTINEFPFFSFMLGDMHPHVLALPFAFVALGFALNLLRSPGPLSLDRLRRDPLFIGSVGLLFGGLGFLNAWDIATFLFVLAGAFVLQRLLTAPRVERPSSREVAIGLPSILLLATGLVLYSVAPQIADPEVARSLPAPLSGIDPLPVRLAAALCLLAGGLGSYWYLSRRSLAREAVLGLVGGLVLSVVLYLPFFLAFRSQAAGLGLVLYRTELTDFFLFWGPSYLLAATFLVSQLVGSWRETPVGDWTRSPLVWGATAAVAIVSLLIDAPVVGLILPLLIATVALVSRGIVAPVPAPTQPIASTVRPRTRSRRAAPVEIAGGALPRIWPREHFFVLLLAFVGLLLILGCEILFIRDFFNNRMNTVFKLYYQAWVMLALVGAYAAPYLWARYVTPARERLTIGRIAGLGWGTVLVVLFFLSFLFPYGMAMSKTRDFAGPPTLDGLAFWARARPDEMAAINWLNDNVDGAPVVIEATGGSYQQQFGRVASMTGLPTILGWDFHEQQWRGSYEEQGRRKPDIETLYRSADRQRVLQIMRKYEATYLYVGPSEREAYGRDPAGNPVDLARFGEYLDVAYQQGGVTIYQLPRGTS